MKKSLQLFAMMLICTVAAFAQMTEKASFNFAGQWAGQADSLRPYSTDKGIRSIWYAGDLDGDGKKEFITTDYTNGGRVHVWEFSNSNTLQLVWSSPRRASGISSGSTPRWVRTGDLDGDGAKEIIFPLSTSTNDFEVEIYEYQGSDNNYGTTPAFTLPFNYFAAQSVGNFRTNREVAMVEDVDGDGASELIMSNRDHSVYVLGVFGQFPGFASWQLEGGDPAVVTANSKKFSISHWHSVLADINGDGKKEIINNMWNKWGFWMIKPRAADTYSYPDTNQANYYREFFKGTYGDHVPYMGLQVVDLNGDGRQEIAGIMYGGDSLTYSPAILAFSATDSSHYVFAQEKIGIIGRDLWKKFGQSAGSFWGIGAADLNGNGRQELLLGGSNGYNVTALEYKGTGSLLDSSSYDVTAIYKGGAPNVYNIISIYDSAGRKDTVREESPFVSKMSAGFDSDNNGKKEVACAYQSVLDSITIKYYKKPAPDSSYKLDSTKKIYQPNQIAIRILEYGTTGIEARDINMISPDDYVLQQNYPNPFNPTTNIRFSLPTDDKISVVVYDMLGREVSRLINNQEFKKGGYEITWDGTNSFGHKVASGFYVAEMKFGNFSKTIKMNLLK